MKKVRFMSLALLVVFAIMGFTFAAWQENISASATVQTGEIDAIYSSVTSNDPAGTMDPGLDKDVADTEVTVAGDSKSFTCTIDNSYPGYTSTVTYIIENTGTVPITVSAPTITNNNADELSVTDNGTWPQTLDPGATYEASFTQTVTEQAAESSTYTYSATIDYEQWNTAS